MMIILWLACFLWLAFTISLLTILTGEYLSSRLQLPFLWRSILRQFRALRNPPPSPRFPLDLWVWETANDEEACEDCRERAAWPPMDIADWMKEGLPRTPESDTHCGENCRCQIVPYKPRYLNERHPQH